LAESLEEQTTLDVKNAADANKKIEKKKKIEWNWMILLKPFQIDKRLTILPLRFPIAVNYNLMDAKS